MNIIVASNGSMGLFPENTASFFRNSLPRDINLQNNDWEVGVKKLIYRNSFKTIVDEKMNILMYGKKQIQKTILNNNFARGRFFLKLGSDSEIIVRVEEDEVKPLSTVKIYASNSLKKKCKNSFDFHEYLNTGEPMGRHSKSLLILKDEVKFTDEDYIIEEWIPNKVVKKTLFTFAKSRYENFEQIVGEINQIPTVQAAYIDGKLRITFLVDNENIQLMGGMHYLLGLKTNLLAPPKEGAVIIGDFFPQLNRGRFAVFLYSNICKFINVADTEAPLLDIISIPESKNDEIVSIAVSNPMYVPVAVNVLKEIEIHLCSDTGETLSFFGDESKTIVTLHFRKINKNND